MFGPTKRSLRDDFSRFFPSSLSRALVDLFPNGSMTRSVSKRTAAKKLGRAKEGQVNQVLDRMRMLEVNPEKPQFKEMQDVWKRKIKIVAVGFLMCFNVFSCSALG